MPYPTAFPSPETPPLANAPILIYGAGSTTGQYAIQLLHSAGYKNVLATASSKHHEYLRSLGATSTFDYNSPTLIEDVQSVVAASEGGKLNLVLDCITAQSTMATISKMVSTEGTVAVLLPLKIGSKVRSDESDTMYLVIPDELNTLPKGTRLAGVRTFLFEEASTSVRLLAVVSDWELLDPLFEGEFDDENPARFVGGENHPTQQDPSAG